MDTALPGDAAAVRVGESHPSPFVELDRPTWARLADQLDQPFDQADVERLRGLGYPEQVLGALDCLTKREGETYEAFIERLLPHPLARRVKRADLEDNMDVRRLPAVTAKDAERLARYRAAWARLQEA